MMICGGLKFKQDMTYLLLFTLIAGFGPIRFAATLSDAYHSPCRIRISRCQWRRKFFWVIILAHGGDVKLVCDMESLCWQVSSRDRRSDHGSSDRIGVDLCVGARAGCGADAEKTGANGPSLAESGMIIERATERRVMLLWHKRLS